MPNDRHQKTKENIVDLLEVFDNSIPVIGIFMDTKPVDEFERMVINDLVDTLLGDMMIEVPAWYECIWSA